MKRVFLDEGVPKRLARRLQETGLDVEPFPNGMKQLSNGALLREMEKRGFDVLLTNDKRMQFQQSLNGRQIAVVILPSNLSVEILRLVPAIADAVRTSRAGEFLQMSNALGDDR